MGRPIKSLYFGNRNENGVLPNEGGITITDIYVDSKGSGYTAIPALNITAPQLPAGVAATYRVHMEVSAAAPQEQVNSKGYTMSSIITATGGTGIQATYTLATAGVHGNNSTTFDGAYSTPGGVGIVVVGGTGAQGYGIGDTITVQGGTFSQAAVFTVTGLNVGAGGTTAPYGRVTQLTLSNAGSYTVLPTGILTTTNSGAAAGLTINLDGQWTAKTLNITNRGNYTALPGDITSVVTTSTEGTGLTVNTTYRVLSIDVLNGTGANRNRGYVRQDTTIAFATGNASIDGFDWNTTDTNVGGSSSSRYTLLFKSYINGQVRDTDVIRQRGTRTYILKAAVGSVVSARLYAHAPAALGQASLTAWDDDDHEYWVTKVTAHKCIVVRKNPSLGIFADPNVYPRGQLVRWGNSGAEIPRPDSNSAGVRLETTQSQ